MAAIQCPIIGLFQQKDTSLLIGIGERIVSYKVSSRGGRGKLGGGLNTERCLWRPFNGLRGSLSHLVVVIIRLGSLEMGRDGCYSSQIFAKVLEDLSTDGRGDPEDHTA